METLEESAMPDTPEEIGTLSPEEQEELRVRLFEAQRQCRAQRIPVLVIIGGVDGSGRGKVVNLLNEWMDAKGMQNHAFWLNTDEEKARPEAWRFWRCLPTAGEIGIFMGGWYAAPVRSLCCGDMKKKEFDRQMAQWTRMEESLAASGMVIIKLWLHLSRKTHKKRLKKRGEGRHFAPWDKKSAENYDGLISAASRARMLTDKEYAPWIVINAKDAHVRDMSAVTALLTAMDRALAGAVGNGTGEGDTRVPCSLPCKVMAEEYQETAAVETSTENACEAENLDENPESNPSADSLLTLDGQDEERAEVSRPLLESVDLSLSLDHEEYRQRLDALQEELGELTYRAWKKGISSTLVFEGWDAAGKGGAIRRLNRGIDARIRRVVPVAAPSDEELAHHYLWRFWRHVPMKGLITMYDRSWYGRVLVERVENLTPPQDWQRAYDEINDFEAQLIQSGGLLIKYWLHISPEEQLRRFQEREQTPCKQWKITQDDWRNREKRPAYLEAAEEMFRRTGTPTAPWYIVPAEDKKFARVTVLEIYRDALEKVLKN